MYTFLQYSVGRYYKTELCITPSKITIAVLCELMSGLRGCDKLRARVEFTALPSL